MKTEVIDKNLILDGLEDASNYIIRVAAVNNIGTGIYISQDPASSRNPQEASDPFFANTVLYSHLDDLQMEWTIYLLQALL